MVEETISKCLPCQATGKSGANYAPLQMSEMPGKPWSEIAIDFNGPIYPSKEYITVAYDTYSRNVFLKYTYSTAFKPVSIKLDDLFTDVGIPDSITTDNCPPFNGQEFKDFAKQYGFKHRLITPYWPRANGMVESFMKRLNKAIQTAKIEGVNWKVRINEFLRNYRSTPHKTTGVPPGVLFYRNPKFSIIPSVNKFNKTKFDKIAIENDKKNKDKMKSEADKRLKVKSIDLKQGDFVLVKRDSKAKSSSFFEETPYLIIEIKGNMIRAKNNFKEVTRNVSFFKKWRGSVETVEKDVSMSLDHSTILTNPFKIKVAGFGVATDEEIIIRQDNQNNESSESLNDPENGLDRSSLENDLVQTNQPTRSSESDSQLSNNAESESVDDSSRGDSQTVICSLKETQELIKNLIGGISSSSNTTSGNQSSAYNLRPRDKQINYSDSRSYSKP
ncbi:unnamed protein product [Brachionus calyciflorus]|uniref:Integrase catalytic domain-containing protein n=1 Tax=Brachionus calyciflorus TaxID=104777 RepID=A0A813X1L1_9BILA|nr:unnamed protein product [Brachionus calyciflorus]